MKTTEILLTSSITALGIALIILILILFIRKKILTPNNGKVMFEINRKNRTFRYMSHKSIENNKIPHTNNTMGLYSGKWSNSESFINIFSESTIKSYREAIHQMETKEITKIEFPATLRKNVKKIKNATFKLKVILNKATDDFLHATIVYKTEQEKIEEKILPTLTSRAFQNYKTIKTVMIIFNTKFITRSKIKQIVRILNKNINIKSKVFLYKGRLVFAFSTKKPEKLLNHISKVSIKIIRDIKNTGIGFLCSAGGVLSINAPDTPKKINEAIMSLEFLINKSYHTQKLERLETKDVTAFKLFRNSYIEYDQALRTGVFDYNKAVVKKYKTKKPLVYFLYPNIKNIDKKMFRKINSINYLRTALIEKHTSQIISNPPNKPSIINVSPEWFLKKFKEINNKNIVYSIDIRNLEKRIKIADCMNQLQSSGYFCGVRLSDIRQDEINFIEKVNPKFIIIGYPFSSQLQNPNVILKLINLNEIIKGKEIKVIFENPSLKIDKKLVKKIGLDFFYNYK